MTTLKGPFAWAQTAPDPLGQMEQQLFSQTYPADSRTVRLERLENTVLGQTQSGDSAKRQARLENVLLKNAGGNALATPQTSSTPHEASTQQNAAASTPALEPDATSYPAVSQLERQIMGQTYEKLPVSDRLDQLEKRVYHQTYPNLAMVDRVDQLTLKVLPNSALRREEDTGNGAANGLPDSGRELAAGNLAVYAKLNDMENQVFGQTFGGQLLVDRLNRLEKMVLGSAQRGSVDQRVDHLAQRLSLPQDYPQVGQPVYTARPGSNFSNDPYTQPPQYYQPQQRVVGTIDGKNLSPEFLQMLPADVRQQVANPNQAYLHPNTASPFGYMPRPARLPNPTDLVALNQLEAQIFGQSHPNAPLSIRLNNLEQRLFGRAYPNYSMAVRINRLMSQAQNLPPTNAGVSPDFLKP